MKKSVISLLLGFCIGLSCQRFGIPVPAPPELTGVTLILAMTLGYLLMDHFLKPKSSPPHSPVTEL